MPDRPNVVFIFSDQQRYDTLACYGNSSMQVPHLNALADESFVFQKRLRHSTGVHTLARVDHDRAVPAHRRAHRQSGDAA